MKTRELFAIAVLTLLTGTPAHADIFKCTGADGHVMYSNMADKNCKKLSLDPVPSSSSSAKSSVKTPTPSAFPKVDENSQKARDNDRRRILESELAAEQANLGQAKKDLAEQESLRSGNEKNYQRVLDRLQPYKDKIALHERNIEAIQKEIANLR
ncbi:MAG: DUF4124 domain-containing protein [Betaproteobacteria bacterium]